MSIQHKYRVNKEKHEVLGNVAPLEEPFVLLIDPSNLCNFRCKFCPTGDQKLIKSTGRYNGLLDFTLFTKIIDDLKEYSRPIKTLRLYKEGEPLLNPKFEEMVAYARKSAFVQRIDTTSNGALLTPERNRKIVEAGLDQINISVNGITAEQIYYFTKTKVNFSAYVDAIRDLYENRGNCEISIKAIKENLTEDEQKVFYDIFGPLSTRISLEHISPAWPQFELHEDVISTYTAGNYGQEVLEREVCPYIFYIMVINSDGRVSTCVGDWPNKLIVGDVRKQSVRDIWKGVLLNKHRIAHLEGKRWDEPFCADCEVVTYGTLDNLDSYAGEILSRMRAKNFMGE
ncbi:MAG: radical SAM/SPASM domain-containing protein [Desulfovibrionaceae bacterium]